MMGVLAQEFPQYNWQQNKGYPTKAHIEAIKEFGHCKWHRKSFFKKIFAQDCGVQLEMELN
ncbi:MAG: hypothetical protein MZV70_76635 [Desulfobacterales bacterium]|nr:hypothetical protein [Desulfobacterales bacterium]